MSDSNTVENNPENTVALPQDFPVEILQHILEKLPIKDVLAFAKTSKDARYIVNDDMLWKYLVDRDFSDFDKDYFSEYNKENRNYREQYEFLHKQKANTDWSYLITTHFNDFDKKFFLNTTELASDYEKYKYLHTQKKQTLRRYREKFDELANNNLSEKNACLAIMLAFYPDAKDDIEYYKNNGATETEAQNLINNAKSDNPILYNYTSYFNAFLQINFDVQNNRIYDGINTNKALPLIHVVANNLKEHVVALIRAGADVVATDPNSNTAISCCNKDNPEIAKIIIQAVIKTGKLEQPLDQNSNTSIIYATIFGLKDEVTALLKAGANPFATNKYGNTAIACCNKDNPDIAKILMQAVIKTGNLERPIDNKGTIALMCATHLGLKDEVTALIDAGANVFAADKDGITAIARCIKDNPDIAKILMQAVIKTGKLEQPLDQNSNTSIIYAALFGLKDEVSALIDAGANVFAADKYGNTAIIFCRDNPDIAKILIQAVIKTGKLEQPLDQNSNTPLIHAAMFGLKDEVTALLNPNANVLAINKYGNTAIYFCRDNPDIAKILMQAVIKTGKLEQPLDLYASTPLIYATIFGLKDEVTALIDAGANVFAADKHGDTAICFSKKDNPDIDKILIQAVIKTGKLEQPLNQDAYTPLIYATIFGLKDEVTALIDAGANVFAADKHGDTAICFSKKDNPDIDKILIQAVIKTGKLEQPMDSEGTTPLLHATIFGLKDEVTALLKAGANVFAASKSGATAITFCATSSEIRKIIFQAIIKQGKLEQPMDSKGTTPLKIAEACGFEDELRRDIKNTENEKTNPPLLTAFNTSRSNNEEQSDTDNCDKTLRQRPDNNRRYG